MVVNVFEPTGKLILTARHMTMKPKRLTDRTMRMIARRERDGQWEFMERVAREGTEWLGGGVCC